MLGQTHRRVNLAATSRREGTTASAAPSRRRSGRSGARLAWGEAGTLPGVAEGNGEKLVTLLTSWETCEPGSLKSVDGDSQPVARSPLWVISQSATNLRETSEGLGSRLYFAVFTERAGRRRAWHNNLINLESRVDGSPIFLASIGTRIKFSQGRFIL